MKKLSLATFVVAIFSTMAFSQNLKQTVRGTIIDIDNKLPLIGATVSQTVVQSVRGLVFDNETQAPLSGATIVITGTKPLLGA